MYKNLVQDFYLFCEKVEVAIQKGTQIVQKRLFLLHDCVTHNFKTNYGLFLEIWEIVLFFCLTLFRGGVQICTPLPRCDKNKNLGRRRRPKLFTFNIIILDVFCENLAYVAPPIQILQPFSEEDPQMLQSEPCKMAKLGNVL